MTISEYRRLRVSIATLSLLLASAVCADRAEAQGTVPLTLNANVQLTKLHPDIGHVGMSCLASLPSPLPAVDVSDLPTSAVFARSSPMPVVNRGYAGIVTATMNVPQAIFAIPANRTLTVTCKLEVHVGLGYKDAVASAAQPADIIGGLNGNPEVVATGSVVTWTQAVTFPSAP